MEAVLNSITYPPIPIQTVGPLAFSLHGVFAALGFFLGATYALKLAEEKGLDYDLFSDGLNWALFGAIIGARFFTIPAHLGEYGYGLDDVFSITGSYSIMGGMSGGIIAAYIRIKIIGNGNFVGYADCAAPALILGTVIGRIGDLAIVEHLGRATTFILGYEILPGYDVAPQHNNLECVSPMMSCGVFHHVAMYDLIISLGMFFVFRQLQKRYVFGDGSWLGLWAVWYGALRLFLDSLRFGMGDSTVGSLTWNQIGGLSLAACGLVYFYNRKDLEQTENK